MGLITLILISHTLCIAGAGEHQMETSKWHIADIYKYCSTNMESFSDKEKEQYANFLRECQDSENGNFIDSHGDAYYSVKVYHLLKRLGYEPKYPLGVCQQVGTAYCEVNGVPVTENMRSEDFRRWLDKVHKNYDAYGAGSLFGHFITPHIMNLQKAGKTVEDSPFVEVFHKWLLENQGENGFWNRSDDLDSNGWNGVMKMDSALGKAKIKLPNPDRMLKTVLKYQRDDGVFYVGGGCSNHNALHTLRQWSKRYDMLMWEEIFRAMERFANNVESRYDPVSGYFYPPYGSGEKPQFAATELASMEIGNVITYCRLLLDPDKSELFENQTADSGTESISPEKVRRILIRAAGIQSLATERVKLYFQEKHEKDYGSK